jgi:hypothetical protein
MKKGIVFLITVVLISICRLEAGNTVSIMIRVGNQNDKACFDLPVIIDLHQLVSQYQDFIADSCIVLSGEYEIPSQLNDNDGDGQKDELVFVADFKPLETRSFLIADKSESKGSHIYAKRTQAELSYKTGGYWENHKYIGGQFGNVSFLRVPNEHTDHSFFIRYEGPGWESDRVGYRFYLDWRNAIDIFGKLTDTLVLQHVGLDGFESYHEPAPWGMDIFKVGKTLGLGSVALWKDQKVNMVSETDSVTCHIVLNGPVESMIETNYYGWKVGDVRNNLNSKLSIYAGSRVTEHQIRIAGDGGLISTGLIRDKKADLIRPSAESEGWTYMATWGCQSLNNDSLGIALLYNTSDLVLTTDDSVNYIVVLKPADGFLHYYLLGAWEKEPGGIRSKTAFIEYLNAQMAILNKPLLVRY